MRLRPFSKKQLKKKIIRGNGLSSAGDKSLTVRSPLFFLKIVRIERESHMIDRLCTVRCSFFFSRGLFNKTFRINFLKCVRCRE